MRRRLFTVLSVLSLLAFVVLSVGWVQSYSDKVWWIGYCTSAGSQARQKLYTISSQHGYLVYKTRKAPSVSTEICRVSGWFASFGPRIRVESAMFVPDFGDASMSFGFEFGAHEFVAMMPCWFLMLLSGLLPLRWLIVTRRERLRRQRGHCPKCGYNLTGNVSGTCPECGKCIRAATSEEVTA